MRSNRTRLVCAWLLFAVIFIVVAGRAFQLQILQGDDLRRMGERQHLKEWIVLPKRGTLFDRAGEPLALSLEAQSLYARPRRIQDSVAASQSVAKILKLSGAEVRQKLDSDKPFVWIKRQIAAAEAEKIQALKVEGLGMFFEPNRFYPQGQLGGPYSWFCSRIRRASRDSSCNTTNSSAARADPQWRSAMRSDGEYWFGASKVCRFRPGAICNLTGQFNSAFAEKERERRSSRTRD